MYLPFTLIVRLWLNGSNIAAFEAFERKASRLLARHGGKIEHVYRIASSIEDSQSPFEIHIVRFPNRENFAAYRTDPDVLALATERATVIARTEVQEVTETPPY